MHSELSQTLEPYDGIIFVGGGTGGHISPIISLHEDLKFSRKKIFWIGGKWSEEEKEAKKNEISFFGISVLKLSTTRSYKTIFYPFLLGKGFFEARKILKKIKKETPKIAIFSKWWPGAVAIGLAGKSLKIPLFIHESDTIPGRSNMILGQFANKIFLGFESSKKFFKEKKCIPIGQIIDKRVKDFHLQGNIVWKTNKPRILVLCGSQWAKNVFEEIANSCQKIDAEWIIVLGKLNTNMREKFSKFKHIQILDWLEKTDQNTVFQGTDIAITRGSATTLSELQLFDIQKIIIPLPSAAKNHQYFNALEYQKQGDILLEQKNISRLNSVIHSLI